MTLEKPTRPAHRPIEMAFGRRVRAVNWTAVADMVFGLMAREASCTRGHALVKTAQIFHRLGVPMTAKQVANHLSQLLLHVNRERDHLNLPRLRASTPSDWEAIKAFDVELRAQRREAARTVSPAHDPFNLRKIS